MRKRPTSTYVLIALGVLLVVGGVWTMRLELTPFATSNDSQSSRMLELAGGGTDYGLSISSRQVLLFDCRQAMLSLTARLQPTSVRSNLNTNCLAASDALAAEQPTFAIAWLTGAVAASQMADWEGFNLRLARSFRVGPVEQWIAEMRVSMAEQYFDRLTDDNKSGNAADMRLLTDTDPGLVALARIYVQSPSSRGRITATIDATSDVTREKFVRRVRTLSTDAGL
jgi:hypothetical protein